MDEVKSKSESKEYKIDDFCVIENKNRKQGNTNIYRFMMPHCCTK
jgi:hypothetical protein